MADPRWLQNLREAQRQLAQDMGVAPLTPVQRQTPTRSRPIPTKADLQRDMKVYRWDSRSKRIRDMMLQWAKDHPEEMDSEDPSADPETLFWRDYDATYGT